MNHLRSRIGLALILILVVASLNTFGPSAFGDHGSAPADPGGNIVLTEAGHSSVGGGTGSGEMGLAPASLPPSKLARPDYAELYAQAKALLDVGVTFRTGELQLPPSGDEYGTVIEDPLQNYQDFNGGDLFYRFCANYDEVDEQGYCPEQDVNGVARENVRNKLVRARELFAFMSLAEPVDTAIEVNGEIRRVRQLGKEGVLAATREVANVHMIFGNEFMVDASDYRFSSEATSADNILNEEINLLALAQQQFSLSVDVLAHAFNADFGGPGGVHIGDYFTAQEFDLFGITSERMVASMEEIANRYRQLGQDEDALAVFSSGFSEQYVQSLALAQKAQEQDTGFFENGGWEMMSNLGRLRAQAQTLHDGINPFGYKDEYVPLQTYAKMDELTRGFLQDATEDEQKAASSQREFDRNSTALNQELQSLRTTYDRQLLELCGASDDDYETCEGGLMEQNHLAILAALDRIALARQRAENIPQQIQIEQDRAGRVIDLTLQGGQQLAAIEYAKGVINSYRVTKSVVESETSEWHVGVEAQRTHNVGVAVDVNPLNWRVGGSIDQSLSAYGGYRHAWTKTKSVTKVWDPAQEELGHLNGLRDVQQAATQAQIVGANSVATIRNLLLEQAELLIQVDIALDEFNQLASEHNHLVERYHNLLNLREKAQNNLLDSYLNNPAYRILRESSTLEASRSHGLAAHFAYLTAKALEYEFLTRPPFLDDVFKARTADQLDNYLLRLMQWREGLESPGDRNRFPYRISVARDVLGLSDENLDPEGQMTAAQRAQLRYELFQETLQGHLAVDEDTGEVQELVLPFTTSLLNNNIFSPNIWNNRIAGVGLPEDVPGTQGVSINLVSRQFGDVGTPEAILQHGGHASYRTATNQIVSYTPANARVAGYPIPEGFESVETSAVILSSVNGNNQGSPSSALFNRSVAASEWRLRIDLTAPANQNLDISLLEDIEINMDTTAIALNGREKEAETDARQLQAEFTKR